MTQQQILHHPAVWIKRLARFGYASKEVVYFIVGLLASMIGQIKVTILKI